MRQEHYTPTTAAGDAPVVVQGTPLPTTGAPQPPVYGNKPGMESAYNPAIAASGYNPSGGGLNQPIHSAEYTKGEKQPKRCNDVIWAILFYLHLAVIVFVTATFTPKMAATLADGYDVGGNNNNNYNNNNNNNNENNGGGGRFLEALYGEDSDMDFFERVTSIARGVSDLLLSSFAPRNDLQEGRRYLEDNDDGEFEAPPITLNNVLVLITGAAAIAFVLSSLALTFMMNFAKILIKMALFFNMLTSLLFAVAMLLSGVLPLAILALVSFAISACYAYYVWPRIPFAAANLVTAVSAVRANFGVSFFAYTALFVMIGWSMWWSVAFLATNFVVNDCDADGQCQNDGNPFVVFLLLLSFYWTQQVIKNVVHVTVAGTVGTWWFAPHEASSCCSSAVRESYLRSITFSFGSICMGSLLVAILEAIKNMIRDARERDESGGGMLLCCAECLVAIVEFIAEYFNQWAFVYVGLYGYTFMNAAKNVMTLFRTRGWTTIITDNLVDRVLVMVSFGVGLIAGLITLLLGEGIVSLNDASQAAAVAFTSFLIGFLIGFIVNSVLMGVVASGVNTVIVCYAEAPAEFQQNHPQLSTEMQSAWRQAWPVDFHY